MVRIWDKHLARHAGHDRLPPIVPVVLHHGERPWSAPTRFSELLACDATVLEEVVPFSPEFRCVLDDLSGVRDSELSARVMTALGQLTLFCLVRARRSPDLVGELEQWLEVVSQVLAAPNGVAALARS